MILNDDDNKSQHFPLFHLQSSKARTMSQAYHRYALNYINALNYLETLRRQVEFTEFEKVRGCFVLFLFLFDK